MYSAYIWSMSRMQVIVVVLIDYCGVKSCWFSIDCKQRSGIRMTSDFASRELKARSKVSETCGWVEVKTTLSCVGSASHCTDLMGFLADSVHKYRSIIVVHCVIFSSVRHYSLTSSASTFFLNAIR